ncbi:MAG: IS200/IS605 family transposase [Capsulimonadaceae bacterium]|nr:IS200/IS605 family transposase [Capsulimonadaceae bacterium]
MSSHAFYQLYYHFAWSTKGRQASIEGHRRLWLAEIVAEEARRFAGNPLACTVLADHIHLLISAPPTMCVSDFIGKVKGASAFKINKGVAESSKIVWQAGYGVVSLRKADVPKVRQYVINQEAIHARRNPAGILEIDRAEEECSEPR